MASRTPNITIFRMCYGENGTVNFFETLADNVFRHIYSMMQIKEKIKRWEKLGLHRSTPLKHYLLRSCVDITSNDVC
jgi:hypothetical protein